MDKVCTWTELPEPDEGLYETDCGCTIDIVELLVTRYEAVYCPWCGGHIRIKTLTDQAREREALEWGEADLKRKFMIEEGMWKTGGAE